jgi:hypothetical protein
MKKKKKVIIYLYNRLFDPLIQSNFWLYINDFLQDPANPYELYLVTYEDNRFPLNAAQQELVNEWEVKGLKWKKLQWHPGQGLKNKFMDIWQGFWAVAGLRMKGYNHIVSLASVAGSFAYLYSIVLRTKLFLYQFEPHSEYAIDNKMWAADSTQYKLAHWLERKAVHYATVIASGTRFMEERLKQEWKVKAAFVKIPTVANDKKFIFNQQDKEAIRQRLHIGEDKWLLYYPGKFGDLYYREETAFMFKWLLEEEPRLHFLIVTPHTDEEVKSLFDQANVPNQAYTIAHSDYADIHQYASASDFAVIAVPAGPSKKFISNIKVGEYLCAGLPFLITRGISEDYIYAETQGVGVVVDDFRKADMKAAWPRIKAYLEMDPQQRRRHCRKVGLDYRGFEKLNLAFKKAMHLLTN